MSALTSCWGPLAAHSFSAQQLLVCCCRTPCCDQRTGEQLSLGFQEADSSKKGTDGVLHGQSMGIAIPSLCHMALRHKEPPACRVCASSPSATWTSQIWESPSWCLGSWLPRLATCGLWTYGPTALVSSHIHPAQAGGQVGAQSTHCTQVERAMSPCCQSTPAPPGKQEAAALMQGFALISLNLPPHSPAPKQNVCKNHV